MSREFDAPLDRRGTDSVKWDWKPTNRSGSPLLPMWVADMDFAAPPAVRRALTERIRHPVYGYTFVADGHIDAFTAWQQKRNAWELSREWVIHTPGVMPAVRAAILAFTEPGDEVVIQPPVYFPFFSAVSDNDRAVLENPLVSTPEGYRMDLEQLEDTISSRTRMLLLCSPHNPVGRVWSAEELSSLADLCTRHDLLVVSDEIHGDLIRNGHRFVPFAALSPELANRTITCASPSKTFNIAGLSSSFAIIADRELRARFRQTMSRLGIDIPNPLSLTASAAAYAEAEPWLDSLLDYLSLSFNWFEQELHQRLPEVGLSRIEGTYLAWLDFRRVLERCGASDVDLQRVLLEEAALWLSHGPRFGTGGSGFQRMNLGCPRTVVADGLERLERAVDALQ